MYFLENEYLSTGKQCQSRWVQLFYALHEYLFASYGVGLGDKRMLKFPAKTKMTMGSINI